MRKLFPGFYKLSDEKFKTLWEEATFILDTNVILNLYRYPKNISDEMLSVLENLKTRLWIPFQVGLEYQRHRLGVIVDQQKKHSDMKSIINKIKNNFLADYNDLKIKKRHSSLNFDEFQKDVDAFIKQQVKILERSDSSLLTINSEDSIRKQLDILLDGKIGPSFNQLQLDELYSKCDERYKLKIPPGYMDIDKGESEIYSYGGINYKCKYGDFIIWHQIKDYAKDKNIQNLIFLTDDGKEDWWYYVHSDKDKRIGPRPELIQEIRTFANDCNFHMYNSEHFLTYANQYLGTSVSSKSIQEVSILSKRDDTSSPVMHFLGKQDEAQYAVMNWLKTTNPGEDLLIDESFPGYIINEHDTNKKIGYNVLYSDTAFLNLYKLTALISQFHNKYQHLVDEIIFVIVGINMLDLRTVKEHSHVFPKYSKIYLGTIGYTSGPFDYEDSMFLPLFVIE